MIVSAPSQPKAILKYIQQVAIRSRNFLRHVYGETFAENFWLGVDEKELRESKKVKVRKEDFNRRVRKFFGAHKEYADV